MQPPAAPGGRHEELDALRGLAAFSVLTAHLFALHAVQGPWTWTPFNCGLEAVRFFFILSGFVLAQPFLRGPVATGPFLVKRIARIWPPYAVALVFAGVLLPVSQWRDPGVLSDGWLWAKHFLLVGHFDVHAFNPVIWSLVIEMRVSLLFPLLVWLVLRPRPAVALAAAVATSLAALAAGRLLLHAGWTDDWVLTLHYAAMFAVGILIARHREALVARWQALAPTARLAALAAAAAGYTWSFRLVPLVLPGGAGVWLQDWLVVASAATFIVAALAPGGLGAALRWRPLQALGLVSYSLYLFHQPLVFVVGYRWVTGPSFWPFALVATLGSLVLAAVTYHLVERPAMNAGRALAARLAAHLEGARGVPVATPR